MHQGVFRLVGCNILNQTETKHTQKNDSKKVNFWSSWIFPFIIVLTLKQKRNKKCPGSIYILIIMTGGCEEDMGIVQLQVCKDVTRESGHPLDHANVWNTASLVFLCVKLTWAIPLSSTFCPCHLTIAHWLSICLFFSFFPVRVKCQQHAGSWWPPTDGLGKRLVNC